MPDTAEMQLCDTPDKAAAYWRQHVTMHPYFNRDVECFVVLLLNTRRKIQGHYLISTGTLDTILVHAREVFRPAIVGAAAAIVLMHNHRWDPAPGADIKVTRPDPRRQLPRSKCSTTLSWVGLGREPGVFSLRELGYFTPNRAVCGCQGYLRPVST
jgi:hypothetical protein